MIHHKSILSLLTTFIASGSTITLVSYLSTYFSAEIANIIWVYPISIIFAILFMKNKKKTNQDICQFLSSTLLSIFFIQIFVFLTLIFMFYKDFRFSEALVFSIFVWIITSIIFYFIFKNINILKLFDKLL